MKLCKNAIWRRFVREKLEEMGKSRHLIDHFHSSGDYEINGEPYTFIIETKEDLAMYKRVFRLGNDNYYGNKAKKIKEQNYTEFLKGMEKAKEKALTMDASYVRHMPFGPCFILPDGSVDRDRLVRFFQSDYEQDYEHSIAKSLHAADLDKLVKDTQIIVRKDIKTLYISNDQLIEAQKAWDQGAFDFVGTVATSKDVFDNPVNLIEFENTRSR